MINKTKKVDMKSFLSSIEKINPSYFSNSLKNQRKSKQKEKFKDNEKDSKDKQQKFIFNELDHINSKSLLNNKNSFITNNNNINTNQFFQQKNLSKDIINNITNQYKRHSYNNSMVQNVKNISSIYVNKNKDIVLNKIDVFKNVKFKKPTFNKLNTKINLDNNNKGGIIGKMPSMNKLHRHNNTNINNTNYSSNTNTMMQSKSSLNIELGLSKTSTDITTSTKRMKECNLLRNNTKIFKEDNISNNKLLNLFHYNTNITNFNSNNNNNMIMKSKSLIQQDLDEIKENQKQILPMQNRTGINMNINMIKMRKNKNLNKDKKNSSEIYFNDLIKKTSSFIMNNNNNSKKINNNSNFKIKGKNKIKNKSKPKPKVQLNNLKIDGSTGNTIISDDSVFNLSKHRSSSGTHNDSSKISKGSNTLSIGGKSKSMSVDFTYSDDEVQTNRRKNENKLQLDNFNSNNNTNNFILNNNKIITVEDFMKNFEDKEGENDTINSSEFKNFCNDLNKKLFGINTEI